MFERFKRAWWEVWEDLYDENDGDTIGLEISCNLFAIVCGVGIVGTGCYFFPNAALIFVLVILVASLASLILYGPLKVGGRLISKLRHDNPDDEDTNEQGLGS